MSVSHCEKYVAASGTHPQVLKAAPVDRRQLRQWQCTVCSTETLTCSTTDPQAQEAARGLGDAAASIRGRAVGSLLAGEIADDEAAITTAATAVRCIVLLWAALWWGRGLLWQARQQEAGRQRCR